RMTYIDISHPTLMESPIEKDEDSPDHPYQRRQEYASVTPTEEFRTAMRGYEKSEVDSRLQQLRTEVESVRKALADARSQVINADRAKLQIAGELSEAKAQLT